jgi:hypothetical protein
MFDATWRSTHHPLVHGRHASARTRSALRLLLLVTLVGLTSAIVVATVFVELLSRLSGGAS